jgi:ABC-type antimicrobial peptide transport system permease subunit
MANQHQISLLTAAGIAIGVATIVALGAVAEGLRTGYASMFSEGMLSFRVPKGRRISFAWAKALRLAQGDK